MSPRRLKRILRLLAVSVLLLAAALEIALLIEHYIYTPDKADFIFPWQAARYLRAGLDPYQQVPFINPPRPGVDPQGNYWFYPLPAALVAFPFSFLSSPLAGFLYSLLSLVVLLVVAKRSERHYLWPMILSACVFDALYVSQWSPWLFAAGLIPALGPLLSVKPTLGAAVFVYRPTKWAVVGGAVLVLTSFLMLPSWLGEWLAGAPVSRYPMPLTLLPFGPFLLLALLRWREPRGRLLVALSLVPQRLFLYDQLLLFLVCQNRLEAIVLSACSWLTFALTAYMHDWNFPTLTFMYLPALLIVLRPLLSRRVRPFARASNVPTPNQSSESQ